MTMTSPSWNWLEFWRFHRQPIHRSAIHLDMNSPAPRYHGKPFVRLLECYVLWAINELPEKEAHLLTQMTPKMRATYHKQGDWPQIVAAAVELPEETPVLIRELWTKNLDIARRHGVTLTGQEFAEMFVDENLAH